MAIDENKAYPAHGVGQAVGDSFDKTRDRLIWTLIQGVLNGNLIIANWSSTPFSTASPEDLSVPDYWLCAHNSDGREIRMNLTYTGDDLTGIVVKYNDGVSSPGMTTVVGGTVTITRDGNSNVTGITTA